MAPPKAQYHHYIPRFILKRFAYTVCNTRSSGRDGLLHVFDMPSGQFRLGEVAKTCGAKNLYYNTADTNPMRIEELFSKLEGQTSTIFSKIHSSVADGLDHIDILEKDIHILFKFMNISAKRSQWYRDELVSPYRENDFVMQSLFEAWKKRGGSGDPSQFWMEQLLYLLETSHEDLVEAADGDDSNASANTYKCFVENYALQIWKAAEGYEFFINDRLVDFEGETQSVLGVEEKDSGSQLIWMTTEDLIHQILPISPEVAVVFCDESRCWESPFAEIVQRVRNPYAYPDNSRLKNAPHKDIVQVQVPSQKRGKKRWPATVAWRVSIGTLARAHHRIIASYSLSHANSILVVRSRTRFEKAKRELAEFAREQADSWKRRGIRFSDLGQESWRKPRHGIKPLSQDRIGRIVDHHVSALDEALEIISTSRESLPTTKSNAHMSWMAMRTLDMAFGHVFSCLWQADDKTPCAHIMHPAIKAAFEAAYPPKHPDHRDLLTIDFAKFFAHALGEEKFAQLSLAIEEKLTELMRTDAFTVQFDASKELAESAPNPFLEDSEELSEESRERDNELIQSPGFGSILKAATGFDVLMWLYQERQDILATFVKQLAVPMKELRPNFVRIRGRRE